MKPHDIISEEIEREALLSLHQHCPADARSATGLFLHEVEDALVAGASHDSSILLNRALGLGTSRPGSRASVERIHAIYRTHGVARFFLHAYPEQLEQGEATFAGTQLDKARGWMKFYRDNSPAEVARDTNLRIDRVGRAGAADFGRIVAGAFGMTPAAAGVLAGLVHDPRWHLLVSYEGDVPVGAGSLFVHNEAGWLEWGATDSRYRRRGSQGAIMCERIEAARKLNCTMMFTETGEAVAGDPQHSYGNIQRYGFSESVLRQNWAPKRDREQQ